MASLSVTDLVFNNPSSNAQQASASAAANNLTATNLQPIVLPSFGGNQTEPNVTYVNSEGPILPAEQSLNPSAVIEIDRNNTTTLENYTFLAYTLEEISQPTNNASIDLLYNVEPNNLPRDINGAIVIDQNTNQYQGKVLTVNLSANRYYREEFDRIVDVEFTQLIPPVNTLNVQDILNENQSLKDLVALLQLQNNELQQSNTQIPDGTLVRSANQLGYFALIDKGKRRFLGFNETLLQTIEATNGKTVIDIEGSILLQIPEGPDYREADYVGTGVTVVNTHPVNAYIIGLINDPYAIVSTNSNSITNRPWLVRSYNVQTTDTGLTTGAGDITSNTPIQPVRRSLVFYPNGEGFIPNIVAFATELISDPNSVNYNPNLPNPHIIRWVQNNDGELALIVQVYTANPDGIYPNGVSSVGTANFFTTQLTTGENILSIRIQVNSSETVGNFVAEYTCIENTSLSVNSNTFSTNTNTPSTPPFFGIDWTIQEFAVPSSSAYNDVTLLSTFANTTDTNNRFLRFDTGNFDGIIPKLTNFTDPNNSTPGRDTVSWSAGSNANNIIAIVDNSGETLNITWITETVNNQNRLVINFDVNNSTTYSYICTA